MSEHYEMPHERADECPHAGLGKACKPCREKFDPMTATDLNVLAEMRASHQPLEYSGGGAEYDDGVCCPTCQCDWPCDASNLLAAVEAVVLAIENAEDGLCTVMSDYGKVGVPVETLRRALTDALRET